MLAKFGRYLLYGCQTYCALYCIEGLVGWSVKCSGPSMEPTIYSDDRVFVAHSRIRNKTVKRGDIVVALNPHRPRELLCKRLVGMEGDTISNGIFSSVVVPKGHVWLEGDNKEQSKDSRDFGPVPYGLLVSTVVYRYWPLDRAGPLVDDKER